MISREISIADVIQLTIWLMAVTVGIWFLMQWRRDRRFEQHFRYEQAQRETEIRERSAESSHVGPGSGGYIVVDMAEQQRPLFHDLLKGFEDYAKLKGYDLSFSIDSTVAGKIAFKFTVKNTGFVVGTERVRKDFREYLEQVKTADPDSLDALPVVTNLDEHNLLMTMLKNRLVFLHHSYQLSQNAVHYYEGLLANVRTFPALPSPSVIVHTGGAMDSRSYSATNSQRLIQGDSNAYEDASVNIGGSFNERQERVSALDDVLGRLQRVEAAEPAVAKAIKGLSNAKDELTENAEPDKSAVKRWLEYAKDGLKVAVLGADVNTAAQKLMALFGMHL